jgi:hypothetical protein
MSRLGAFLGRLVGRTAGAAVAAMMPEAAEERFAIAERERLLGDLSSQNRAGRRETVALLRARKPTRRNRRRKKERR